MKRLLRHILYAIYIVLFCAYAISPVYITGPGSLCSAIERSWHSHGNVQVGLLTVKVVLASFVDDQEKTAANTSARFSPVCQDDELLLVKKTRGVIREHGDIRPVLQATTLPTATSGFTAAFTREYAVPGDPIHRSSDGFIHHATGLSPPLFLS